MPKLDRLRGLRSAGLLHHRLLTRVRLLSAISVLLIVGAIVQTFRYNLNVIILIGIAAIAFVLGLLLFSQMNKPKWDEEKEVIATGRMDIIGVAVLVLYIIAEISFRTLLKAEYAGTAGMTAYLFMGIGASLLGRSIGTLIGVHKFAKQEGIGV
jgi:heme/copper-type cytochrome/quinol oxidase subunit 4